jgi:hypothetical protein
LTGLILERPRPLGAVPPTASTESRSLAQREKYSPIVRRVENGQRNLAALKSDAVDDSTLASAMIDSIKQLTRIGQCIENATWFVPCQFVVTE